MSPVFVVVLCLALVWLLLLMLRRESQDELTRGGTGGHGAEFAIRLPRRSLLQQCLSAEDLEYIEGKKSPALLRLFLRERRRLAIAWLRQTRREAQRLLRWHLHSARYAADLRPAAEARLFWAVGLFLLVYAALVAAVWWHGPLGTRRSLESIQRLARILGRLMDRIVAGIAPAALPGMDAAGA